MRPTKYWLIAEFLVGIVCVSGRPCPEMQYGRGCRRKCKCIQVGTKSCDQETGNCLCKPGFTGPLCEPVVDPCADQTVCKEKFEYCNPINSKEYECLCSSGYMRTPSRKCYPCREKTAGANCGMGCDCHAANTAGCSSDVGTCICMFGWAGPRCEHSVDDCVGNPCRTLACIDEHRGYVCQCNKGQRFIRGRCLDYEVVILVSNDRPMVGDTISVYLVYSLSKAYRTGPLLQPDFKYQLYVNDVRACKMSFHSSFIRILGNEKFMKKLSSSEKEFQFYSHYQVHMEQAGTVTLRADPASSDYTKIFYVIEHVRPWPNSLTKCFRDMSISGAAPCPGYDDSCGGVDIPKKKRQSFHIFKVTDAPGKDCQTNHSFTWAFFKFHKADQDKAGHCYEATTRQPLNIDQLIAASGQPLITDHDDIVEIVPKNTLPLGQILICVTGHLRGTRMFSATYCGVFEIVPSYVIVGVVRPHMPVHYISYTKPQYSLLADYKEPDLNLPLKYEWSVTQTRRLNNKKRYWRLYDRRVNINHKNSFFGDKWGRVVAEWKVTISLEQKPSVKAVEDFVIHYGDDRGNCEYFKLLCHAGCEGRNRVGSSQDVILSALEARVWWREQQEETYKWSFIHLQRKEIKRILGESYDKMRFNLMIKANSLKPGKEYFPRFYKNSKWTNAGPQPYPLRGALEYNLKTAPSPSGGRCTIAPESGTVMATAFTVSCKGYKVDTDAPIRYHLYQQHSISGLGKTFFSLIAYGGHPILKNLRFSSMQSTQETNVLLQISVVSIEGSPTISNLQVKLSQEGEKIDLQGVLRNLYDTWWSRSLQENVRYLYNIATRISEEATSEKEKKILVTNKLLEHLGNHEGETAEWIEHTAMALERITSQAEQIRPPGLEAGLAAAERLAEHISRTRRYNFDTLFRVSRILLFALDHLIHAGALLGKETLLHKYEKPADKADVLEQMKKYAQQSVSAIVKISHELAKNLVGRERALNIEAPHTHIGIRNMIIRKGKAIQLGKKSRASFFMGAEDAHVNHGSGLVTQFQSFDKNPYAFDTENIHGDFPVIKVEFFRMNLIGDNRIWNGLQPITGVDKVFKFKEPAHIFLSFNNTGAETLPYSTIIDVETRGTQNVVVKSSCVFLSVPVSIHGATVLEVHSDDDLILKAKFGYTNNLSTFDDLSDKAAFEIPLNDVKPLKTPIGLLHRDPYLLYLPKLSERAKKESVGFYRVAIGVKQGLSVDVSRLNPVINQEKIRGSDSNLEQVTAYKTSITITPYKMACKHFDDKEGHFLSKECSLTMYSNTTLLHCLCAKAAAYTGSFLAVSRIVEKVGSGLLLQLFNNPVPVSVMIGTWMVFLSAILWAREKDRQDVDSCRASVLGEHSDKNSYLYLICVKTGWSVRAATTSIAYLYIKGYWGQSETHSLSDNSKHLFKSGAHDWFLLATEDDLGEIQSIVVWTDFSGEKPSWFLFNVIIKNLQTKESWTCHYNGWLSFVFGSKQILAVIPALKDEEKKTKESVNLRSQIKHAMRNDHLWLGVFAKSPSNHFTRVRRLVTVLTMLQMLMFLNFIFTGTSFIMEDSYHIVVFGQTIYLTTVLFSFLNSFITTVLGTGLAYVFDRTTERPVIQKEEELSEEQKDVMSRRDGMNKRLHTGLWKLYPPLPKDGDSSSIATLIDEPKAVRSSEDSATERQSHDSEKHSDTGGETTADKKDPRLTRFPDSPTHFLLPWWTVYVTWITVVAINLILTHHLMLKGLSLSYGASLQWFVDVVLGFLIDLLIFTPAKVAVTTTVKALLLHERSSKKEAPPISSLEQAQILMAKEKVWSRCSSTLFRRRVKRIPRPMSKADARGVLDRLKTERVARTMFRDLILYTIFTATVLAVIRAHLDVKAEYRQTLNVEIQLLGMKIDQDHGRPVLPKIHDTKDVWDYLIGVSTKRLVLGVDAQDKNISHTYYMMTHVRLRQVRTVSTVATSQCAEAIPHRIWPRNNSHECLAWGEFPEEMGNFTERWVRAIVNTTANGTFKSTGFIEDSPYRYWTARDLKTAAYVGDHGWYSGGGYVIDYLREDPDAVADTLNKLKGEEWIDRLTRCVFLEFTVYNHEVDMFTQVILAFEMDRIGGVITSETIHTANLSSENREENLWLKVAEAIAVFCVLFYTLVSIQFILYHGFPAFIKDFWNWVEVLAILLSVLCVLLYAVRHEKYKDLISDFKKYGNSKFLDFTRVFHWQIIFHHTVGFYGALVIFKMVKVTTFNPFTKTFIRSLMIGFGDFMAFLLATVIIMAAFGALGQFSFGANFEDFSSFSRTQYTLLFFILGELEFHAIVAINSFIARFFFIGFLFCSQYLVINLFISILRDSLEIARLMSFHHEQAVIRYMVDSTLLYFNLTGILGWRVQRDSVTTG